MKTEAGNGGRTWQLTGADGKHYDSTRPGSLGGHRRSRIYGRLDCRAALQAIARGGYVANRVFFLNQADAEAAGYRPCAVCLSQEYAVWKANKIDSMLREKA
ncbi:metal binding Ada-like protein [Collimonas sp. PA-H2]|uniref:Ada metal-binding domain-containing protein n=1 Tax=Collimonas sp. PA-H2 TaxID=1881062 RepID=UPI000BF56B3F|nr:Ada metal-binding domain-containing protein [Collimonas sp. PA-H2]PFH11062.1 metal binding Ada-like protein [Collimonas sp. PA-H2]